jgi:hypothetical protein
LTTSRGSVSPGVLTPEPSAANRAFFSTDAVVVVPGFLGSSLSDTQPGGLGLIWVDPLLFRSNEIGALRLGPFDGREADASPDVRIVATGAIPIFYDLPRLALEARRYTTAIFAVDWRRDLGVSSGADGAGLSRRPGAGDRRGRPRPRDPDQRDGHGLVPGLEPDREVVGRDPRGHPQPGKDGAGRLDRTRCWMLSADSSKNSAVPIRDRSSRRSTRTRWRG